MTIYIATQHYMPDGTSTAAFMTGVAEELARESEVVGIYGRALEFIRQLPVIV